MKTKKNKLVALLGIFALLALSLSMALPSAHADSGGNQIRVQSATLVFDGTNWVWQVTVSATVNDPSITAVNFALSVSYGSQHLNINKQGLLISTGSSSGTIQDLTTQVTLLVPYMGPGYYLFVVSGYNAATGALLGSDWVDPQGTAG